MNLRNLIAERNALNRLIATAKVGRIAAGCTVKIKGTAKLPIGTINREMTYCGGDGAFINFTVTKRARNILYVRDNTGWNTTKVMKINVNDAFGVKA